MRSGNPQIIGGAIGYMAFDVAALAAAFAAIGVVPPIGVLLLAYVVGQLGNLIPLPGGVGGADGGLIAALVLYGTPLGGAAAAVLAYRAFQLGLPALLGGLAVLRLPGVVERAPDTGELARRRGARRATASRPARASRSPRSARVARQTTGAARAGAGSRRGEVVRGDHAADRAEQVRLPGDPLLRQQALEQADPPDAGDQHADRSSTAAG